MTQVERYSEKKNDLEKKMFLHYCQNSGSGAFFYLGNTTKMLISTDIY